jgi:hypothetical protein
MIWTARPRDAENNESVKLTERALEARRERVQRRKEEEVRARVGAEETRAELVLQRKDVEVRERVLAKG